MCDVFYKQLIKKKNITDLNMGTVALLCNPSTGETEEEGEKPAWAIE